MKSTLQNKDIYQYMFLRCITLLNSKKDYYFLWYKKLSLLFEYIM